MAVKKKKSAVKKKASGQSKRVSRSKKSADGTTGRVHPVVHFEIGCTDRDGTAQFYSKLFGWKMEPAGPAVIVETGTGGIGGHITSLGYQAFQYTMFYVEVENIEEMLQKAMALGGKTMVPPVRIPTGTFAWMLDPEGNTIGLWQKD